MIIVKVKQRQKPHLLNVLLASRLKVVVDDKINEYISPKATSCKMSAEFGCYQKTIIKNSKSFFENKTSYIKKNSCNF